MGERRLLQPFTWAPGYIPCLLNLWVKYQGLGDWGFPSTRNLSDSVLALAPRKIMGQCLTTYSVNALPVITRKSWQAASKVALPPVFTPLYDPLCLSVSRAFDSF